jgi:hypothetical protein
LIRRGVEVRRTMRTALARALLEPSMRDMGDAGSSYLLTALNESVEWRRLRTHRDLNFVGGTTILLLTY